MFRRLGFAAFLLAILPASSRANDWSYAMFDALEHDFGKVERGNRLTHSFVMTNQTGSEVRIRRVSVSCSCTQAYATNTRILPGQSATIEAVMDTSGFQGSKSVTITVAFDRPRRAEARLRVSAISLGSAATGGNNDIDFGVVPEGAGAERRMHLDYTGNASWQITGLDFGSPHLKAEAREISRDAAKVRYELRVVIANSAPAGAFEDRIRIHTNDPRTSEMLVVAKALIEPKVAVSPDTLRFGDLVSGQKLTKTLILKASKPFRILRAENTFGMFEIRAAAEAKTTQLVMITLTVPADHNQLPEHLDLVTDLDGDKVIAVAVQK